MEVRKTVFLVLTALFISGGGLWYSQRPLPPPSEATCKDIEAEAKSGGYRLITTAELGELYQRAPQDLLLVDTRQDWEYRLGHMKGAVNFSLEPTWWSRWRAQGPLAALLGPDKNRLMVFY